MKSDHASSELESNPNFPCSQKAGAPAVSTTSKSLSLNQSDACFEQNVHPVARFLRSLNDVNIYIAIQSVLDAVDLWLGAFKYFYDVLSPLSSKNSAALMYGDLSKPLGLFVFLFGGVFFASFAFIANYFDEDTLGSKFANLSKYADDAWPYVRDFLKAAKWTFKGTRSVFIVMNLLLALNFSYLIAPVGVLVGLFAACNRLWNRSMVEERKVLQSDNNKFRESIKYLNTCFIEINDPKWFDNFAKLSSQNRRFFEGCIIKSKQDLSKVTDEATLKNNGWHEKYFYVEPDTLEIKLLYCNAHLNYEPGLDSNTAYTIELNSGELDKLNELRSVIPQEYFSRYLISGDEIYYCNDDGILKPFDKKTKQFVLTERDPQLYGSDDDESEVNVSSDAPVTKIGALSIDELLFLNQLKMNRDVKLDYYSYLTSLNHFAPDASFLKDILKDKESYLAKLLGDESQLNTLYKASKTQDNEFKSDISAFINGLLNAPYYFLGILTAVNIPANLLLFSVGICSFFMILNVIAELSQEFEFQRRLHITEIKAKLSMVKRLISWEWDNVNVQLSRYKPSAPNEIELYDTLLGESSQDKFTPESFRDFKAKYYSSRYMMFPTQSENLKAEIQLLMSQNLDEGGVVQLKSGLYMEFEQAIQAQTRQKLELDDANNECLANTVFLSEDEILSCYQEVYPTYLKVDDALNINKSFQECDLSDDQRQFLLSEARLISFRTIYERLKSQLESKYVLGPFATIMQGIKNGLHIYGMVNGLLMTIYSIGSFSLNLSFFISSVVIGLSLICFATLYTLLYATPEANTIANKQLNNDFISEPFNATDQPINDGLPRVNSQSHESINYGCEATDETTKSSFDIWFELQDRDIMANDNDIIPSKNLLISEQCEVFRQFISGCKKALKFLENIALLVPCIAPFSSLFGQSIYSMVILAYGVIFACKGLRSLMRTDPDDYENSFLIGRFFEHHKPEPSFAEGEAQSMVKVTKNMSQKATAINSGSFTMVKSYTPDPIRSSSSTRLMEMGSSASPPLEEQRILSPRRQ